MSPNNQHKIESSSTSEVNHPSPTIVTLFKDDSNIKDKIRTTATTEITTDEEEESSIEKQHTTTTSSANSSIMTGTPAAASPQTPSNSTDDNTSTNNKDESSPGFEEFLNVLGSDEPKDIEKSTPKDDDNNNDDNIDYGSKPLERRRSSDLGNEMRASNLLNSTNTVVSCSLSFLLGVMYNMILMLDIFNSNTAPSNVSQCQSGFMGEQGRISPSTC